MKRFTVEVEARCIDGATYRILARTKGEAVKKAIARFEREDHHHFDIVEANVKEKKKKGKK